MFEVVMKKSVLKSVRKMPTQEQGRFQTLMNALRISGPEQPAFKNYSKLGLNRHHCHLSYGWSSVGKMKTGH